MSNETFCFLGILDEVRGNRSVYVCNDCAANVARLARRMSTQIPDFDLARAQLLYFYAPGLHALRGLEPRSGPASWYFHAVLEYEGRVLDLDHQDGSRIHAIPDYVANMFLIADPATEGFLRDVGVTSLTNQQILDQVRVRRIPILDALQNYDATKGPGLVTFGRQYANPAFDALYPPLTLKHLFGGRDPVPLPPKPVRKLPEGGRWTYAMSNDGDVQIHHANEGIRHELDLTNGTVKLFWTGAAGKERELRDFDRVQSFLKAVYDRVQADAGLRQLIESSMRKRADRGGAH